MLSLLELIFLLQRKSYCLTTHLEHVVYLIHAMVLEADGVGSLNRMLLEEGKAGHALPEPQLRRSFPQLVDLLLISGLDQLVVNDQQRAGRDVIWEGRVCRESRHIVCRKVELNDAPYRVDLCSCSQRSRCSEPPTRALLSASKVS